ncbi:hypothetical protein ACXR0O_14045 [Verrucomicrobiota bacterium sgz303538]
MSDSRSQSEKEKILFEVADALRDFTAPALGTIIGAENEKEGALVGSGTFIRDGEKTLLLTASHVATKVWKYRFPAFSVGDGRVAVFSNAFAGIEFPSDLAAVEVDPDLIHREPVDVSLLADASTGLEGDVLFIHGYAGANSRFSGIAGGLVSESTPYATFIGTSDLPKVNPALHFAIQYDQPEPQRDASGKNVLLPAPNGLSGSAVWKSFRAESGENWEPSQARIVGVAHSWDTANRSLIVTRVEVVRAFLQMMKRR